MEPKSTGYIAGYTTETAHGQHVPEAGPANYRTRLTPRGLARFEVLGLDADRVLIRSLARRLAENGPEASAIRTMVGRTLGGEEPGKGRILAALRRSPPVGSDIDLTRTWEDERDLDL